MQIWEVAEHDTDSYELQMPKHWTSHDRELHRISYAKGWRDGSSWVQHNQVSRLWPITWMAIGATVAFLFVFVAATIATAK